MWFLSNRLYSAVSLTCVREWRHAEQHQWVELQRSCYNTLFNVFLIASITHTLSLSLARSLTRTHTHTNTHETEVTFLPGHWAPQGAAMLVRHSPLKSRKMLDHDQCNMPQMLALFLFMTSKTQPDTNRRCFGDFQTSISCEPDHR